MIQYIVRCETGSGRDRGATEGSTAGRPWLREPGVQGLYVYQDSIREMPGRTIVIEVGDLNALQRVLDSTDRERLCL